MPLNLPAATIALSNVGNRGLQLQRFTGQMEGLPKQVAKADNPNELKAAAQWVDRTEIGTGLGLGGDEFDAKKFVPLLRAALTAKPTEAERTATQQIIDGASALPRALEVIKPGETTLDQVVTVMRGLRELFTQEDILLSKGGFGAIASEDRAALVETCSELSQLFEAVRFQTFRLIRGEIPLGVFGDYCFHRTPFVAQSTLGEMLEALAVEADGSPYRTTGEANVIELRAAAEAIPGISFDGFIEREAGLRGNTNIQLGSNTYELLSRLVDYAKLAQWTPPTE